MLKLGSLVYFLVVFSLGTDFRSCIISNEFKVSLRNQVVEMFMHGYYSYKNNAFPADELMPLSCKGRVRGLDEPRGDIDDALGNFSLTMLDSLDTLFLLGEFDEFEEAVRLVTKVVRFDSDLDVSVFETNIRVLGGLLGAHVSARLLQKSNISRFSWYTDDLLRMATDIGYRLLPAFNTTTGIPYPRVNLRYGCSKLKRQEEHTCTACAGTMILEFAALSRLTGNPIFEEKAANALAYLWKQRNRFSDLVGRVINVHSGDWVRQESGVGAGIDSYYEYLLKAYIMLGEPVYLHRFQTHYEAVNRYVGGPQPTEFPFLFLDVHMHKPAQRARMYMDALLAFWPGLQVLTGDVKQAVAFHELLYLMHKRHKLLPEAFTPDFNVHWGQHSLRPELIESTYLLYRATEDPYYLEVGAQLVTDLQNYTRVPCGFAAIKDVRTMEHMDQFDSFVLAETFKYLYLLFTEPKDLPVNLDDYIFTTEAHLLPLGLSQISFSTNLIDLNNSALPTNRMKPLTAFSGLHGDRDPLMETYLQRNAQCPAFGFPTKFLNLKFKTILNHSEPNRTRSRNAPSKSVHIDNTCDIPDEPNLYSDYLMLKYYHLDKCHLAVNHSRRNLWLKIDHIRQPLRVLATNLGFGERSSSYRNATNLSSSFPSFLRAIDFQPENEVHLNLLKRMGISLVHDGNGRVTITHHHNQAESTDMAVAGMVFLQDLINLANSKQEMIDTSPRHRSVVLLNPPNFGLINLLACPAHFGHFPKENLTQRGDEKSQYVNSSMAKQANAANWEPVTGAARVISPIDACGPIVQSFAYPYPSYEWNTKKSGSVPTFPEDEKPEVEEFKIMSSSAGPISGSIGIVRRGGCLFIEKARNLAKAGAIGGIIVDDDRNTSASSSPVFTMSGEDQKMDEEIHIPFVMLFGVERDHLLTEMRKYWMQTANPFHLMITKEYDMTMSFNLALLMSSSNSDWNEDAISESEIIGSLKRQNIEAFQLIAAVEMAEPIIDPLDLKMNSVVGFSISRSELAINDFSSNNNVRNALQFLDFEWILTLYMSEQDRTRYLVQEDMAMKDYRNTVSVWLSAFEHLVNLSSTSAKCKKLILVFTEVALLKSLNMNATTIIHANSNLSVPPTWAFSITSCLNELLRIFSGRTFDQIISNKQKGISLRFCLKPFLGTTNSVGSGSILSVRSSNLKGEL